MKTQLGDQARPAVRLLRWGSGFTLVELLVVFAVIAILAALLFPALGKARNKVLGLQCQNHFRRLAFAWLFYADDNNGALAPNQTNSFNSWVSGILNMDASDADNTNVAKLLDSAWAKLGPYVMTAPAFRCPSDQSTVLVSGTPIPRVRSYSMNAAVGFDGKMGTDPFNPGWMTYNRVTQMVRPSPDQLWVFTEEHPDSISDCVFNVDCRSQGAGARLISVPANYHRGSANFSFADGHVELHRWEDARTRVENRYCGCLAHAESEGSYLNTPNNPDVAWLQSHTSSKLGL